MDIRLIFLVGWIIFVAGFVFGFVRGLIFGTHLAVRAYLKQEGAYDGPLPTAQMEYYESVRTDLLRADDNRDAREWIRRHNMPFNAETISLYRNVEWRKSVDGN